MVIGRQDIMLYSARPLVQYSGFYVALKKQAIHVSVDENGRNQNDVTGDVDKKYS
jgi:hypothetical protein